MFTYASAWNEIREKRPKDQFKAVIWHRHTPFKAPFLLWRTLNGKLPNNESLINFALEPSNCLGCRNREGLDIINHIFYNGELARDIM